MSHRSTLTAEYTSYRPLGNRLLVARDADETVIGKILLPDNIARTGLIKAAVISAGPKAEHAQAGSVVLLHRQLSYNKIILNGRECEIVPEPQIVALLET